MWPFALGRDGTPHDDPISLEENSKMCQRQAFTARISWQSEPRQPGSKTPAQQATISPTTHGHASGDLNRNTRIGTLGVITDFYVPSVRVLLAR
jgi:hypothetical protein